MKTSAERTLRSSHRAHAGGIWKGLFFFVLLSLITIYSFGQSGGNLVFRNPVLETGVQGADGSSYRFSFVAGSLDAIVTINGRSDALVALLNTDMNTSGFDAAFQPQVGYNNGTAPGPADWWMEFSIQFVDHATTNSAVIADFNVSGVDIDGNGQYINEYLSFYDMQDYSLESGSGLTATTLTEEINGSTVTVGTRFDGPTANFTNIDTNATPVMVSNHYVYKSSFKVRTGGRSTGVSGASDRMYSFHFRNFTYNAPYTVTLPIEAKNARLARRVPAQLTLSAYPNPATNCMNIRFPDQWMHKKVIVRLFDTNGRPVKHEYSDGRPTRVDLSQCKSGMYIMQASCGDQTSMQQIVKM